ncbi:hypothetical protein M9Y10_041534 [Tritrichomonas musculus]|uniref:Uncharacterized protein n=1 Tax=Tritrichomonas musculus TaxID=1915356 RepID=A0ABR2K4U8_9EUKA
MTDELKNQNQKIINLLETLQEYVRTYAALQSSMVDGFIEIAQTNRYFPGMICSDLIASPELETRKFFKPNEDIEPNPIQPFIPGVSASNVKKIQNEFEKSLKYIISLSSIIRQLNEQIAAFQKS